MTLQRAIGVAIVLAASLGLAGCGGNRKAQRSAAAVGGDDAFTHSASEDITYKGSSIWDIFGPNKTENTVQVNRYLWAASLDVLGFLPIESVDPFTGVIITGYGTPPGGGRSYRATVHIKDPSLSARSLKLAMQTSGGRPADPATVRAVEDAILSRARQMRIADNKL